MAKAEYKVYVDWDNDGGLSKANFEGSNEGFYAYGTSPPVLYRKGSYNPSPRAAHAFVEDFSETDLDGEMWPTQSGTVTPTASTVEIACTSPQGFIKSAERLMVSSYFQAKVTVPSYSSGTRAFAFQMTDSDADSDYAQFAWDGTSETLYLGYTVGGVDDYESVTYNSVTMAYLRFREEEGVLYWETSGNGVVWEIQRFIEHEYALTDVAFLFAAGHDGAEPDSNMVVSEINTFVWPVYTGTNSLLVDWLGYNPFQFDVEGHGFDQGRFGILDVYNPADPFTFGDSDLGFGEGRFAFAETSDTEVLSPAARLDLTGLVIGREYTAMAHVLVPSTNTTGAVLSVVGLDPTSTSTLTEEWETLSVTFTATAQTHTLQVRASVDPVETDMLWLDQVQFYRTGEDVTARTLGRTDLDFSRGRDTARSLDNMMRATMALEIDNRSRDYSPENEESPIYGDVGPGKPVLVAATFQGIEYPLFRGYVEDYEIKPYVMDRSVNVQTIDLLGYMGQAKISTELYKGLSTGQAMHKVLDAAGWPADKRVIDSGATVIAWWCEDDTTIAEAVDALQKSEGPPSLAYVDGAGNFVFRDRHHRMRLPASRDTAASFVMTEEEEADGDGAAYSPDFTYEIGWKDLINEVVFDVEERAPSVVPEEIYSSESVLTIRAGETKEIAVSSSDPFYDAITPVDGTDFEKDGNVSLQLSRTSGASLVLRLLGGVGGATIYGMKVRATKVAVVNTIRVEASDPDSIAKHRKKSYTETAPWLSVQDAEAIAKILIGLRATRLPVVTFSVKNGSPERMRQILNRNLSDRVHVTETETFTDHDFYVEKVTHSITGTGSFHRADFTCERVREQVEGVFTFDDPDHGFDDGVFGLIGIDNASNVFILNQSSLDEGLLGH